MMEGTDHEDVSSFENTQANGKFSVNEEARRRRLRKIHGVWSLASLAGQHLC